jgi:hypothetical protein
VIDEGIDPEHFVFASQASVDNDAEGIVRYLVTLVADDVVAKKIVALEILYRLV